MNMSWGRYFRHDQKVQTLNWRSDGLPNVSSQTFLPYGNGRSYGDSCLNKQGVLLDVKPLNHLMSFNEGKGTLVCESGVLLGDIAQAFAGKGWFLPVTPGTQYVTVGGAIANDVHGKNHHLRGTFGHYVKQFALIRNGEEVICSPNKNTELFKATVGGLGLTGVITWAEIELKKVSSLFMRQINTKMRHIDDFLKFSEDAMKNNEYVVSWVDCQAAGKHLGRGYFTVGEHATVDEALDMQVPSLRKKSVPIEPPISCINNVSIKAFNALYMAKQQSKRVENIVHYDPFFYPLDGLLHWNKLYGRKGFMQFQCVVPMRDGRKAIIELLEEIARSRQGSFLTVLKVMGKKKSLGVLSFAREGITLAIDFPFKGEATAELFCKLYDVVMKYDGAIYPAKDSCMPKEVFDQSFPEWQKMNEFKDQQISSDFWRRVTE